MILIVDVARSFKFFSAWSMLPSFLVRDAKLIEFVSVSDYLVLRSLDREWNRCLLSRGAKLDLCSSLKSFSTSVGLNACNSFEDVRARWRICFRTVNHRIGISSVTHNSLLSLAVNQISRDVLRTLTRVAYFAQGEGREILRRVMLRMSQSHFGYVQGMNCIIGIAVYVMETEARSVVFCEHLFDAYNLYELFDPSFELLANKCLIFDVLLAAYFPGLSDVHSKYGLSSEHFTTEWWLTLFTSSACDVDTCASVLHRFLVDEWKWLFRVGLSLIDCAKNDLVMSQDDPEKLLANLRTLDTRLPEASRQAQKFKVTNRMISAIMRAAKPCSMIVVKDLNTKKTAWEIVRGERKPEPLVEILPKVFSQRMGKGFSIEQFLIKDLDTGRTRLFSEAINSHR